MASSFREAAARGRQQQDYVYKDRQPQYNADGSFNRSPDSEIEKAKARYANPDYYYQGPGWDVGREDRIQQQKDALRKAAMQRRYNDIRAAQAAAVQGGAPVGGGNPYVDNGGYSSVGDPEAYMQSTYANRGYTGVGDPEAYMQATYNSDPRYGQYLQDDVYPVDSGTVAARAYRNTPANWTMDDSGQNYDKNWNSDTLMFNFQPSLPEKYTGMGTTPLYNQKMDDSYGQKLRRDWEEKQNK